MDKLQFLNALKDKLFLVANALGLGICVKVEEITLNINNLIDISPCVIQRRTLGKRFIEIEGWKVEKVHYGETDHFEPSVHELGKFSDLKSIVKTVMVSLFHEKLNLVLREILEEE